MATAVYSVMHFLVDALCAWAMLGRFSGDYAGFLVYNFCAFALQLPFGVLADALGGKRTPAYTAAFGAALTMAGLWAGPAVLGVGNALFHVGGGIDTIREDFRGERRGALLGIFVAPGALGLYLGGQAAGNSGVQLALILLLGAGVALALHGLKHLPISSPAPAEGNGWRMAMGCFAVVVLRSFVGMNAVFSWKTGFLMGLLAVLAVVLGKIAGGLLAARFGMKAVTALSLSAAAVGFAFGEVPLMGLLALLCFNMTMPLTLYALARRFPGYPGAVFGLLTLALFLGYLPGYYGWHIPLGLLAGCALSAALLLLAVREVGKP